MNNAGESPMNFNRIINGMVRAAQLDAGFYETVEHDTSYTQDSLMVVILVSLLAGIGGFLGGLFRGQLVQAIVALIVQVALTVVYFFVWAFLVHWIGTSFFKGTGDSGEVRRCLGFAYAPQALLILSFIPCVGGLIGLAAWIWSAITAVVATRQALDIDNTNAILTIVISVVVMIAISVVIGLILATLGFAGAVLTGAFR